MESRVASGKREPSTACTRGFFAAHAGQTFLKQTMTLNEKPKPPPPPTLSRLAPATLVETIDGPVQIVSLVGKVMPVLTRFEDGTLGFRMMREIRLVEEEAEQVRLTNTDGQIVQLGADHVLVDLSGKEVRAADVAPGDQLEPSWSYPREYVVPEAVEYAPEARGRQWLRAVVIRSVEPVGRGPVYGFSVNQTKSYFLTFGALSRAQI